MNDLTLYINTSDKTSPILKPYSHLFTKYWGSDQKVVVNGFNPPDFDLPVNFTFNSMASEQIGGANGWSTYLREAFEQIDDELILWSQDDHFIARPVNHTLIDYFIEIMKKDKNIGRIGLTRGISKRGFITIDSNEDFDLIELDQQTKPHIRFTFRITGQFSIWNRQYLLRYLVPGISPWEWEIEQGKLAENDGFRILASNRRFAVHQVEGQSTRRGDIVNILGLKDTDVEEMIDLKLLDPNKLQKIKEWA